MSDPTTPAHRTPIVAAAISEIAGTTANLTAEWRRQQGAPFDDDGPPGPRQGRTYRTRAAFIDQLRASARTRIAALAASATRDAAPNESLDDLHAAVAAAHVAVTNWNPA